MSAKYPLKDLLRVRNFREDNAAKELTRCRAEVKKAEELLQQQKQELADYIKWRILREEEMYQEVMEKKVQLKELDDLKQDIQMLREKEFAYEERIRDSEQALQAAKEALEQAHQGYQKAVKDRQKIDEHKGMWAQETAKISEANQEKELEDFRVRSLDNDSTEETNHG